MGRLRATLKWGFLFIVMLLVLLVAAWAVSRAMYPTEEQREAIAQMEQHPDYAGENAFPLLWTLDRDVPDADLEAVIVADVRRFSEKPAMPAPGDEEAWKFVSVAEEYPALNPSKRDRNLFCGSREKGCLARVREDLETYKALIERNQKLLDRVTQLQDYDYVQSKFPQRITTPLPSYQNASLLRTRHVVQFAEGRTREALAATCRDIATWRRLGAHSDNLITQLIGVANSSVRNGYLLANMLSELPVDMPLPKPCDEALAPPTLDDVSMCDAMRGEFAASANATRHLLESVGENDYLSQLSWAMMFDAEAATGMRAEGFLSFCSQPEHERLRADLRDLPDLSPRSIWRFACLGNPIGCIMNSIGWSHYAGYRHRLQDHGARLRVLGTLAWMRRHANDGHSPSELLAARPDELKSPARDIEFGPEGQTLRVPLYDTGRSEYWSIPLPLPLHSVE